jgi:predicted transcriptional regulator
MKEKQLDLVFQALASEARRYVLDIVRDSPGCTVAEVSQQFEMSRIGVLKHINCLEHAGLIVSRRSGRERQLYVNLAPLQVIHERWSDQYRSFWASRLTGLKRAVEEAGEK